MKTPTIKEIKSLVASVKASIDDECRAYEESEKPSILLTVGCNESGNWDFQTGDTSFSGGAYGFPFWGQVSVFRNSNCENLAREIIEEIKSAQY